MTSYTQLTQMQRYQIYASMKAGFSQRSIATEIGVHPSTISRELKRNRGGRGYRPDQAQRLAEQRRQGKVTRRLLPSDWQEVERLLRLDWSPEQISQRLFSEHGQSISTEWIYRYVYHDKAQGGTLYRHLRCQKKRRKRYGQYDCRGRIKGLCSIDERLLEVESRQTLGHWEGDTIIGKHHQGAVVTQVERKSRYTVLAQSDSKQADAIAHVSIKSLVPYKDQVHSMTYDRGKEFADHQSIARHLETEVYFAHAYSPWERGTNENTNGLIRQYLPKSVSLKQIPQKTLQFIMERLNHRPRKCLNWKTPYEVFFNTNNYLTIALSS